MANPQQPELARNRKVPALEPDATEAVLSATETPAEERAPGGVPADNLPGHHPEVEQDKPSGDDFVARAKGTKKAAKKSAPKKAGTKKAAATKAAKQATAPAAAEPVPVGPSLEEPEVVGGGSDGDLVGPAPTPGLAPEPDASPAPAPPEPVAEAPTPQGPKDLLGRVGDLVGQARRTGESVLQRLRSR